MRPEDRVVDLGTGCGVIPMILAFRGRGSHWVGLEVQPELAALARRSVAANGYADRIAIHELDMRQVAQHFPPESFDLAVSNPPYRRLRSGRINPHRQRAVARHELAGSVEDVLAAGRVLLGTGGRLAIVYPATRLGHLLATAQQYGFSPKELTVIYSDASSPARLVHLECRKGGGEELRIQSPFLIYGGDGGYSEPMRRLYEE